MADIGFNDIRPLFSALPPLDDSAADAVREHALISTATAADVDAIAWMTAVRGAPALNLDRPRIAVFAGLHRGASGGFDKNKAAVEARIDGLSSATDPLYDLCGAVDVDLRLYEMALHEPAGAEAGAPSLGEGACARAIAYGLMAVEDGLDIVGVTALSPGIDPVLETIADAAFGLDAQPPDQDRILDILADAGGHETAALFGAMLAARIARTPVLLDGASAIAAAALLAAATDGGAGHCRAVASGQTDLEARLIDQGGLAPAILKGPTEGDGRGAARAILALRASADALSSATVQ